MTLRVSAGSYTAFAILAMFSICEAQLEKKGIMASSKWRRKEKVTYNQRNLLFCVW